MDGLVRLEELRREVGDRCATILAKHPDWPCRAGCDQCCKNLARLPELNREEWTFIEEGLHRLPEAAQFEIAQRMNELEGPPFVCPFLDRGSGRCRIYEHRPLACRTFGFYVERAGGRYCGIIRERVERGEFDDVVWGNHEAVDLMANRMGERVSLGEWRKLTGLLFFKRS